MYVVCVFSVTCLECVPVFTYVVSVRGRHTEISSVSSCMTSSVIHVYAYLSHIFVFFLSLCTCACVVLSPIFFAIVLVFVSRVRVCLFVCFSCFPPVSPQEEEGEGGKGRVKMYLKHSKGFCCPYSPSATRPAMEHSPHVCIFSHVLQLLLQFEKINNMTRWRLKG